MQFIISERDRNDYSKCNKMNDKLDFENKKWIFGINFIDFINQITKILNILN